MEYYYEISDYDTRYVFVTAKEINDEDFAEFADEWNKNMKEFDERCDRLKLDPYKESPPSFIDEVCARFNLTLVNFPSLLTNINLSYGIH